MCSIDRDGEKERFKVEGFSPLLRGQRIIQLITDADLCGMLCNAQTARHPSRKKDEEEPRREKGKSRRTCRVWSMSCKLSLEIAAAR